MKKLDPCWLVCSAAILLLFFITASRCAVNQEESPAVKNNNELGEQTRRPGIYPDTIRLFDIVGAYPKSTWKDLDRYYKVDIPKYHSSRDYTDNLKKLVIMQLVNTFDLIGNADQKTVEYYVNEQTNLPIPDADVLIKCLNGLKGYWPDERIRSTAASEYDRLIAFVRANMKDPDGVLARHKSTFDKLKDFAENY